MLRFRRSLPFALVLIAACSGEGGEEGAGYRLIVDDPNARACEAVLEHDVARAVGARFDGVSGVVITESPLTAISFTAAQGGKIGSSAVQLLVEGSAAPIVARSHCYDERGLEISGAIVRVGK